MSSENNNKKSRFDDVSNGDLLGDEFEMDVAAVIQKASGESVECKRMQSYTLFAKNFACNICSATYPGDETAALKHVEECRNAPLAKTDKSVFCYVCWKMVGVDNKLQHLAGSDHNRIIAYRDKNAANGTAYWITNSGATQVKPLKASQENAVLFHIHNWSDRLMLTLETLGARDALKIDRIVNQIKTAIQSGAGNKNAVSARLGENSTLIAAIDALIACVTIGLMPCSTHAHPGNEHDVYDMLAACERFLNTTSPEATQLVPSKILCKGACKLEEKKYGQCRNELMAFKYPGKLYILLLNMRETVIGKKE